jgi:hypothetical protein
MRETPREIAALTFDKQAYDARSERSRRRLMNSAAPHAARSSATPFVLELCVVEQAQPPEESREKRRPRSQVTHGAPDKALSAAMSILTPE